VKLANSVSTLPTLSTCLVVVFVAVPLTANILVITVSYYLKRCSQLCFCFSACNCPATCNAQTGECECPKRVIGPLCDQCAPQTFGYDATIGCMDCNCKPEGVLGGNLDCDLDIGSCDCKPNVDGRKCDTCINGYWNYPVCEECDCDPAGEFFFYFTWVIILWFIFRSIKIPKKQKTENQVQ